AYIKFGQAISNLQQVPFEIRQSLARLTSHAAPSPRWGLWQRHDAVVPVEYQVNFVRMGPSPGSASENEAVSMERVDGTESILLLQRPYAERLTAAGFTTLQAFVRGLRSVDALHLNPDIAEAAQLGLKQAEEIAAKETNMPYRMQQVKQAQE